MLQFKAGNKLVVSFDRLFEVKAVLDKDLSTDKVSCEYGQILCASRGDVADFDGDGFVFVPADDPFTNVYTPAVCEVVSIDKEGTATLLVKGNDIEIKLSASELSSCAVSASKE